MFDKENSLPNYLKTKKIIFYSGIIFILIILSINIPNIYSDFLETKLMLKQPVKEAKSTHNELRNINILHPLNTFFYDLEDSQLPSSYAQNSYSGKRCILSYGKNTFNPSFEISVSKLDRENIKNVGISAWINILSDTSELKFALVLTIEDKDHKTIFWKGVGLDNQIIPIGKWTKISGIGELTNLKILPEHTIKLYFWNNCDSKILIDDITVVFGNQSERFGQKTYCDLTAESFKPSDNNLPPFPFHFFKQFNIENKNSIYLINNENTVTGEIKPYQQLFTAHLTNNKFDDIFIFNKTSAEIYSFFEPTKTFRRSLIQNLTSPINTFTSDDILVDNFAGNEPDEILFLSPKNPMAVLSKLNSSSFKIITAEKLSSTNFSSKMSGDFDHDGNAELLLINDNGTYDVYKLSVNHWTLLSSGIKDEWNKNKNSFQLIKGSFLKQNEIQILSIVKNNSSGKLNYDIYHYNTASKKFESVYPAPPITSGIDTLKTTDQILVGNFDEDETDEILRYNRDWRYDLKLIKFNKTGYVIESNIDFSGFKQDQNPKYYELLRLIPGKFVTKKTSSLLTIMRNCKNKNLDCKSCKDYQNLNYLPNSIQLYVP